MTIRSGVAMPGIPVDHRARVHATLSPARRDRITLAAASVGMDAFAGATPSTSEHRAP